MAINFNHVTNDISASSGSVTISGAAVGGGSWVFLSAVTASNSATVDIETTFDSTYDDYVILASGITPQNNNETLQALLKINGSYQTSGYDYTQGSAYSSLTVAGNTAASAINMTDAIVLNEASYKLDFECWVSSPASTTKIKGVRGQLTNNAVGTATRLWGMFAGNYKSGTQAMTGIRFRMNTGNITSGSFRLYGIKKA